VAAVVSQPDVEERVPSPQVDTRRGVHAMIFFRSSSFLVIIETCPPIMLEDQQVLETENDEETYDGYAYALPLITGTRSLSASVPGGR
jgi:hypothetical protein